MSNDINTNTVPFKVAVTLHIVAVIIVAVLCSAVVIELIK